MTRTRFAHYSDHDTTETYVWVGPGPDPVTRLRIFASRFRNEWLTPGGRYDYHSAASFAKFLHEHAGPGKWKRDQIRRDLRGRLLLCRERAHGLILARVADGYELAEILSELEDVTARQRSLLGGES